MEIWNMRLRRLREILWAAFAAGWLILLFGAPLLRHYSIYSALGRCVLGIAACRRRPPRLKTGFLYQLSSSPDVYWRSAGDVGDADA